MTFSQLKKGDTIYSTYISLGKFEFPRIYREASGGIAIHHRTIWKVHNCDFCDQFEFLQGIDARTKEYSTWPLKVTIPDSTIDRFSGPYREGMKKRYLYSTSEEGLQDHTLKVYKKCLEQFRETTKAEMQWLNQWLETIQKKL
jgi:hypothetical protein